MHINIKDFEAVKNKGEELYKQAKEVYCPYFKEKISFNTQGLEHLIFRGRERVRSPEDQYMGFKLLHLAPEILKMSHTLQGIWETKKFERVRMHSRTENVLKLVNYYEFVAVVKRNRVKVIVKQVESGEKFFWSLIPFWRMKRTDEVLTRLLHDGNPEED